MGIKMKTKMTDEERKKRHAEHSKLHYYSGHSLPNKQRNVKIDKDEDYE